MAAKKSEFQEGDIVQLKSGGPSMTVLKSDGAIYGNESLRCAWFGGKKLEHGTFPPASLIKVPKEAESAG